MSTSNGGNPHREVKVWVRDINGIRYSVEASISSTLIEVMQKVGEKHRFFEGTIVGFVGDGWDELTTISQILPVARPTNFNEEDYFREHPIQPKFKDSIWLRLWKWISSNVVALLALVVAIVSLVLSTNGGK